MNNPAIRHEPVELRHGEPRHPFHLDLLIRDEAGRSGEHGPAGFRAPAALRDHQHRDGAVLAHLERGSEDRNDRVLRRGLVHRIPEILERLQGLCDREILLVLRHRTDRVAAGRWNF